MNKKDLQQAIREFLSKDKSSLVTEETLTRAQLDKREDYLKDLKKQKKNLIKRYGKDAEAVMYGRATNLAKKAVSEMDKQKLKELVKTSLMTDEVEENKVYGPGELDFSSVVTPEQRIVAKAFMIDPTRTKFDYKNNAVTFPDPIQVELSDGSTAMLGSVKMGNQLGFVKGYFDEDGNEIQGASIKMPYKNPMGEGKKEDMDKDGDIDSKDYLLKRDAAIQKAKGEIKEDNSRNDESLALTFRSKDEFKRAKEHFASSSDFYPFDINDEFKTFFFKVEDQADADSTEFYLTQELEGETDLSNYYFSMEPSPLSEDMDLGHEDNEPHMLKGDLYRIGKYAMELYQMVDQFEGQGEVDFPAWWQAMITDAASKMVKAKHYLDFELKEPAVDAALGVATDEAPMMSEPEAPMMEAEIGKDEILAGKIAKALKDMANKDASDQHNLKQARIALNKGNMDAAKKIAKPYLSEKIAKQLKEYTYDDFSGSKLIANTPIPTDINIFKKFFPTGVASMGNAKASLQASDNSGIKDRMGRYAPMFAHVQYHEFEDQTGEKYRAHQTQYYNSNFDKQDPNFNPSVTDLTLFKLASPNGPSKDTNIGSILVKTNDYIKDLDKLNISKRSM